MKCPNCGKEFTYADYCPQCGQQMHYGGNTTLYKVAKSESLHYRDILSNVFKRHTQQDALRAIGAHPAAGHNMLSEWQKPWMFFRLLIFLVIIDLILYGNSTIGSNYVGNEAYSFAIVTCLIIPMVVSLFVWEMDIHRNVSILDYLGLLFLGGLLACVMAFALNTWVDYTFFPNQDVAWTAGLTEESCKLLISVMFILIVNKNRLYCLDGLTIGAAAGAGFAFWENFQYAFTFTKTYSEMMTLAIGRTVWGIFGSHMLYTSIYVGALCWAMNGRKLSGKVFINPLFIGMLLVGMGAHALNNLDMTLHQFSISLFGETITISYIQIFLGILLWTMLLMMLRKGVNQALETNDMYNAVYSANSIPASFSSRIKHDAQKISAPVLMCRKGTLAGNVLTLSEKTLVLGRQKEECDIVLNTNSVSRKHCALRTSGNQIVFRDLGSKNGSKVNGKRIVPNVDVVLKAGDVLEIGSDAERFDVA